MVRRGRDVERGDDGDAGADFDLGDAGVDDAGMQEQRVLDLLRADAVAAGGHQIVGAAEIRDRVVGLHPRAVAGDEPFAAERGVGLLGPVPVAEHQAGIAARDGEQARLAARDRFFARVAEDRDAAPRLGSARAARKGRCRRAEGDVGRDLGHAERLVYRAAGGGAPGLADARGERFACAETVAQGGEAGGEVGRVEHLAVDPRRGGEDRGAVRGGEARPDVAVGRARMDERGRADGPRVGEARAERVGPVERARVQDAVVGGEPVPAVPHHPPRPGRALGVDDALGAAAGAGGVDDEGGVVRRGVGERDRLGAAQIRDPRRAEDRDAVPARQGQRGVVEDERRREVRENRRDLGGGQQRGDRDRDGAEGVRGEEQDREVRGIAEAQEDAVAFGHAARREAAGGPAHRLGEPAVGPAFGTRAVGSDDFKRETLRRAGRRGEGVGGHVERRGAGREGSGVEEGRLGHRGVSHRVARGLAHGARGVETSDLRRRGASGLADLIGTCGPRA